MKKLKLFSLWACAFLSLALFSCDNEKNEVTPIPLGETIFTAKNGLEITSNGQPLLGKKVAFIPVKGSADEAILRMEGDGDFGGMFGRAAHFESIMVPGVLPGSFVEKLPVKLTVKGDECTFSGKAESEFCTYTYSGKASKSLLQIALTDVALKNNKLAGTKWAPIPFVHKHTDFEDTYPSEPVYYNWDSPTPLQIPILPGAPAQPYPIQQILTMALRMELVKQPDGKNVSAHAAFNTLLLGVGFQADGDLTATYLDLKDKTKPTVVTTLPHMVQYVPTSDGGLKFFINPHAVMAQQKPTLTPEEDVESLNLIMNVLKKTIPMLCAGVPVQLQTKGDYTCFYLNTATLLPLVQNFAMPMLQDPKVLEVIQHKLSKEGTSPMFSSLLPTILKQLPEVVKNTKTLELGINMRQTGK